LLALYTKRRPGSCLTHVGREGIRDKIPPLFESLRASEEVRRRDEGETDPEY
jgi:hypothetical protein